MSKINCVFYRMSLQLLNALIELIEETTSMRVYETSIELDTRDRYNFIVRCAYENRRYILKIVDSVDSEDDYSFIAYDLDLEKNETKLLFSETDMYSCVDRLREKKQM